jgi:hypothetical protein
MPPRPCDIVHSDLMNKEHKQLCKRKKKSGQIKGYIIGKIGDCFVYERKDTELQGTYYNYILCDLQDGILKIDVLMSCKNRAKFYDSMKGTKGFRRLKYVAPVTAVSYKNLVMVLDKIN